MNFSFHRSVDRIREASQFLPGGVSSNFRLGIAPTPLVFDHAEGPFLHDVDGNRLIDYYLGMGPMILGHRPEPVVEAVRRQLERGILFGGQSEVEFEAAELVCGMLPCAERVRFSSSGTEAVQAALRLARAVTGRGTIVKFEGHYHGWLDNILWSVAPTPDGMGAERTPVPQAGTAGQDAHAGQLIEVLSWNRLDLVEDRLGRGDVAAVIMEPAMCNTGAIFPEPGYLEGVRAACRKAGTILIFDEVITGFRVGPGGTQARLGVTPDLTIFGKAVANGFPVAGLAGSAALMDEFATGRKVMHGGTYNSQAITMAATVATLRSLQAPGTYEQLERQGHRLMTGVAAALRDAGLSATVTGFPQIFHVGFGLTSPPRNFRDIIGVDRAGYVRLTTRLLQHGVRVLERGAWFISTTHGDAVIDETIDGVRASLAGL
ncbi:aspartate aminotransferase family protein [Labrys wisconsinensis]|uniref:Glutamate-1-semialdehyde 2,1-aminomutase n=1 Tax=Labrys wisconsinensis TaxID=425677 RepID=A0ABU0J2A2_9HYPH|nr:aspartate aminotransferase family protein [Labrys wisconsinensis]MDQ0468380.1 glutamate-1-semialdehyde 2,1-aminomutase [Labrys wisconsinensis]